MPVDAERQLDKEKRQGAVNPREQPRPRKEPDKSQPHGGEPRKELQLWSAPLTRPPP